jgi:hypothetical protein
VSDRPDRAVRAYLLHDQDVLEVDATVQAHREIALGPRSIDGAGAVDAHLGIFVLESQGEVSEDDASVRTAFARFARRRSACGGGNPHPDEY